MSDSHPESITQQVAAFFNQFPTKQLAEGQSFLQPGDDISQLYYLEIGFVRQYVISADGVELTHHLYKPGSFFPLLLSLDVSESRFYFEAFTEAVVRPAPLDMVVPFLKNHPDILIDLNTRLLAGLNGLLHRLEVMSFGTAQTRVANGLLFLARHFGQAHANEILITQPFTHKNLSHFVGLTRETTSLELEKLVAQQVVERRGANYVILDQAKLAALAEF